MKGHLARLQRAAIVLGLLAITACGADSSSTSQPAPTSGRATTASSTRASTPELDSIAVLGHSGATGVGTNPSDSGADAPENSWATGVNPAVKSIYQRLLVDHPAMKGHNYNLAVNGSTVGAMRAQLRELLRTANPLPDVVLIQSIDNDIRCDGTDAEHVATVAGDLDTVLSEIRREIPDVQIFMVSQWSTPAEYARWVATKPQLASSAAGTGQCDLWDSDGKVRAAGVQSLTSIIDSYWRAAEETCSKHPGCFTDGGAAKNLRITDADIGPDGGHLSIEGHAKLAELVWAAFPEEITMRS